MKAWMQGPNWRGKALAFAAPWPLKPGGSAITSAVYGVISVAAAVASPGQSRIHSRSKR
jgi:hypothetical protein